MMWPACSRTTRDEPPARDVAADFGTGSFVGFRFGSAGNYNHGYLEA